MPKHVDDNTWNDESVAECERLGKAANGLAKYQASKTVAERGEILYQLIGVYALTVVPVAWEWYEKEKPALSWDLTSLNPPWVFGVSAVVLLWIIRLSYRITACLTRSQHH